MLFVDEDHRALISISSRGKGQMECLVWLKDHFDTVGERTPNKDEIHLDPHDKSDVGEIIIACVFSKRSSLTHVLQIFKLYVQEHEGETFIVSFQTFLKICRNCFPHVKLRKYKAVCGMINSDSSEFSFTRFPRPVFMYNLKSIIFYVRHR